MTLEGVMRALSIFKGRIKDVAEKSYRVDIDAIYDADNQARIAESVKEVIGLRSDLMDQANFILEEINKLAGQGKDVSLARTYYKNLMQGFINIEIEP